MSLKENKTKEPARIRATTSNSFKNKEDRSNKW